MADGVLPVALIGALTASAVLLRRQRASSLPLPPGPKGWPVIGNLLEFPSSERQVKFKEWSKEFDSDIVYLNVAGTSMVILDSYNAVIDLFERRGAKYSSRPRIVMAQELMGMTWNLGFKDYGDAWRAERRLFHQTFNEHTVKKYHPLITGATHKLLRQLLTSPKHFQSHLHHMSAKLVLSVAYGIDIKEENDPYVDLIERAGQGLALATVPGAFMVDILPWLKYIPEWVPGAKFQRQAREWGDLMTESVHLPFKDAKTMMQNGTAASSFTSMELTRLYEEGSVTKEGEERICHVAAAMYGAGSDTTKAAISTLLLALLLHPEVQTAAQEEIDRVLQPGTLPSLHDEESLPYVTAVVMELFRWNPLTPIGIPHRLDQEDEYRGYRIPKNSIVFANLWGILHNSEMFPDPERFNPARFIKDGAIDTSLLDPRKIVFGLGRRICPGRFMAIESVWLTTACILASFRVDKIVDEQGDAVEPRLGALFDEESVVRYPLPYKCAIHPRSPMAASCIVATGLEE